MTANEAVAEALGPQDDHDARRDRRMYAKEAAELIRRLNERGFTVARAIPIIGEAQPLVYHEEK